MKAVYAHKSHSLTMWFRHRSAVSTSPESSSLDRITFLELLACADETLLLEQNALPVLTHSFDVFNTASASNTTCFVKK